jgi:hypothetical protein
VAAFLAAGANALEPDVCWAPDRPETWYVAHDHTPFSTPFTAENSLRAYLAGLRALAAPGGAGAKLALIAFDYKDADRGGDVNELLRVIFDEFAGRPEGAGVAILVTISDRGHAAFLGRYAQDRPCTGVGIDEDDAPALAMKALRDSGQKNFAYANGVMKFSPKQVYSSLAAAKAIQAASADALPKLVYTWVLELDDTLRTHLELGLDGVIVDVGTVPRLLAILREPRYGAMYTVAERGRDPWTATPPPQYALEVRTADADRAGSDAKLRFTLSGDAGTVERVIDGGRSDMFERGSTCSFSLDGVDLGAVRSLGIESLGGGVGPDWLPRSIEVRSRALAAPLRFEFAVDEWVAPGRPLTKTPA